MIDNVLSLLLVSFIRLMEWRSRQSHETYVKLAIEMRSGSMETDQS